MFRVFFTILFILFSSSQVTFAVPDLETLKERVLQRLTAGEHPIVNLAESFYRSEVVGIFCKLRGVLHRKKQSPVDLKEMKVAIRKRATKGF